MFDRPASVIQKEIAERLAELDAQLTPEALTEAEIADVAREMERLRSMVEARCARAAALLETSQAWVADGARSATDWLAWKTGASRARVRGAVRTGRCLRSLPGAAAAFAEGDVTQEHVRLLASAQQTNPDAYGAAGEATLLDAPGICCSASSRRWCATGGTGPPRTTPRPTPAGTRTGVISTSTPPSAAPSQ